MFEIGSKIICINSAKLPHTVEELNADCPSWIKEGATYQIRGFSDADFVIGVLLEEVRNPLKFFRLTGDVREPAFRTDRFRLLQEDEVTTEVEELSVSF